MHQSLSRIYTAITKKEALTESLHELLGGLLLPLIPNPLFRRQPIITTISQLGCEIVVQENHVWPHTDFKDL